MKLHSVKFGIAIAAISCGLSACSNFVTYSGDERPDAEISTFSCYSRYYFVYMESCRFQAVDGLRPPISEMFGNNSKILPGSHWIEVAFESFCCGGGGVTDVCAFDIDLQPGYVYQIKAHSLTTEIGHLSKSGHRGFYKGSIDLEITLPSMVQELRQVGVTCGAGGSMCRKNEDCVHHPDIRCFPQEGFPFGACRFHDTQ
jgi:hypothetical protein